MHHASVLASLAGLENTLRELRGAASPHAPEAASVLPTQRTLGTQRTLSDEQLIQYSSEIARGLLAGSQQLRSREEHAREQLLSRLMSDATGQLFTTCLTDRAYRSHQPARIVDAARQLLRVLDVPNYLPLLARTQLRLLLRAGPFVPQLAASGLLHRLRTETRSVVLPAQEPQLSQHLETRRVEHTTLNLNYLGEAVLGEREAAARCAAYEALLTRPDVAAISIKLSSISSRVDPLAFHDTVSDLKPPLRRLLRVALAHTARWPDGTDKPKLVSFDMEAYRDLALTFEVFVAVMSEPEFLPLQTCLVLQAYLPDSHAYQRELTRFAELRMQRGGAPLRLRIVKGANLAAESVESSLRGWPMPTFDEKTEVDANYKRMVEYACRPEHARAVHVGIASHNLFDIGFALALRETRQLKHELCFELLEGMADPLRRTLQALSQPVLLYCPIVPASSMQSAIAYLMRRLDENTAKDNFLRQSFGMQPGDPAFESERRRFEQACALRHRLPEAARRTQDRSQEDGSPATRTGSGFVNEPDTDFALAANRQFIASILERERARDSREVALQIGDQALLRGPLHDGFDPSRPGICPYRHPLANEAEIDLALATAEAAFQRFSQCSVSERASLLRQVARGLRKARGELIAAMVLDAGKRIDQADAEVSEAIDFAEYYADSFSEHARRSEYRLTPRGVVVVTPPWNFPLAIPASGVLAALMAGNTVILKPALETVWVAARLVEICHAAGVPRTSLQLVLCEDEHGSRLIRDSRVANVVLTGATATARKFFELRPDLALLAETGGKNSIIVSDLADRDLAIKDALSSAFGHAGQKCSAASLLICVPEVYDDPAFLEVLRDATESLPVGSAWDPRSVVTPLIQPPSGPLARALRTLDPGERFLVAPRFDPDNPRLVGPCVKLGVAANSISHVTELFGPVLSVMRADDFEHAIELANATPYGLTAGLFTLDEREQSRWVSRMKAGNLYINRSTTGAIVGRQPFGGWKASGFGPSAKAGGPNYPLQLSHWADATQPQPRPINPPDPTAAALLSVVRGRIEPAARERLASAACHYAQALGQHFQLLHDPSAVLGESNLFRYLPFLRLTVRCHADASLSECLLASLAAVTAGVAPVLSLHPELKWSLPELPGCTIVVEDDQALAERIRAGAVERVRQIGSLPGELRAHAADSGVYIATGAVLLAGRLELLHYLREQVVSNAYHRYGSLHGAQLRPLQAAARG